ncbi:hypothetical protein U9M48_034687 [Paspalum notatum var. saurae]|uniref:Uncharacterized protein n=1 Tax=Paspalum notatum var. saurae TaxID=547442 RepID=A0AAQ3X6Y4_PASNO
MGSLQSLQFNLGSNTLTGGIPSIYTSCKPGGESKTARPAVQHNMTGEIPVTIGSLVNLSVLSLISNQLITGTIPTTSVGNLSSLSVLELGTNKASRNHPTLFRKPLFADILGSPQQWHRGPDPGVVRKSFLRKIVRKS